LPSYGAEDDLAGPAALLDAGTGAADGFAGPYAGGAAAAGGAEATGAAGADETAGTDGAAGPYGAAGADGAAGAGAPPGPLLELAEPAAFAASPPAPGKVTSVPSGVVQPLPKLQTYMSGAAAKEF
jgi:hypothetical protein